MHDSAVKHLAPTNSTPFLFSLIPTFSTYPSPSSRAIDLEIILLVLQMAQILHPAKLLSNLLQAPRYGGEEAKVCLARREYTAQVLRVELHANEPAVAAQLDDLHALALVVLAHEGEPAAALLQQLDHRWVHLY